MTRDFAKENGKRKPHLRGVASANLTFRPFANLKPTRALGNASGRRHRNKGGSIDRAPWKLRLPVR